MIIVTPWPRWVDKVLLEGESKESHDASHALMLPTLSIMTHLEISQALGLELRNSQTALNTCPLQLKQRVGDCDKNGA